MPSHIQKYRSVEERRAATLKGLVPPGMTAELAEEFMRRLLAGDTLRKITSGDKRWGPALVPPTVSKSIASFTLSGVLKRCSWRRLMQKRPTL
jgi:hypothetical protein